MATVQCKAMVIVKDVLYLTRVILHIEIASIL
jgi:hypothetical protein